MALCLLTVIAGVETVSYAVLDIASLTLYPVTDRPYRFFAKLLHSSSFTIIWGIADAGYYNFGVINVMTQESFARYWSDRTGLHVLRLEDRLDIADWVSRHKPDRSTGDPLLGPIIAEGEKIQEIVEQGATLITDEVLSEDDDMTKILFCQMDPSLYLYVLTKAVHIYTAGSKKSDPIPGFFKPTTQILIATFRGELRDQNNEKVEKLLELTKNFDDFNKASSDQVVLPEDIQSAFNELRKIATGELQDSLFTTRCWTKASEKLGNVTTFSDDSSSEEEEEEEDEKIE